MAVSVPLHIVEARYNKGSGQKEGSIILSLYNSEQRFGSRHGAGWISFGNAATGTASRRIHVCADRATFNELFGSDWDGTFEDSSRVILDITGKIVSPGLSLEEVEAVREIRHAPPFKSGARYPLE